ncbi:uncharacterized protein MYCFIDRAFT_38100 [Pseudocercospora fijiensis CIRAD86]|uniref:C4-dicarboxylate transporter/malic acid transport protein n=1 Tax=Pseudocercospora fijiensis (strain CIRAD86) TaxID=383855 RepID=M2ZQX5_PSEFD|nr:uncharacterized protein MYCFIDRAFT_38100 [Pseudocercospora fijiensis CIRAD86]EME81479.1 hypothetical protein MYCFIDRAFT_38100 [Pseudocercospora fijiensis CIRAD86]
MDSSPLENGHPPGTAPRDDRHRLPFRTWIEQHFSCSWFTCTQSTGGIAIVISECPKHFSGQQTLGTIVFIFNLVLYVLFTIFMILRWTGNTAKIRECFTKAPECYFWGSFWLSAATLIINMQRYAVPHTGQWMVVGIRVLFWLYAAITITNTTLHIVSLAHTTPMKVVEFQPPMFLCVLNAMLTGTIAGAIAADQPPAQRVPILVAGVGFQGLGWIVCMIFLTFTIGNILEKGWPARDLRPGLFIMTGTTGFTIVALITCARACPQGYGFFATHPTAPEVLLIVAVWAGVFMWVFSLWVFGLAFFITVLGVFGKDPDRGKWVINMRFGNVCWSMIFPNVGWTLSTVYLGQELESDGVIWVSVAMILALISVWLLDLVLMFKAIARSMFVDSRIKLN